MAFLLGGQCALAQDTASIQGKVTDASGASVLGAVVTIKDAGGNSHTTVTDRGGAFRISSLAPGKYSVKISASGLADWSASNVPASAAPDSKPLRAVMRVATAVTSVTVGLPREELAQVQLKQEMKQRVLGVIPNYYVAYGDHPAPLSSPQKFQLGLTLLRDPVTFVAVGIRAGIQQKKNSFYQYGQGAEGYAKRFGAEYAFTAGSVVFTNVLASSVLHQDPRYFYSGKGSAARRAWYAVRSAFLTKGDNGKWQPPYSRLIGSVAAAEVAQLYHPDPRTQYTLAGRALMFRFAGQVGRNLVEEFLLKKVTTNTPQDQSAAVVLREGRPVKLIAVEGFGVQGATPGQRVTFVLAQDLARNGKVLAKAGAIASGRVTQVNPGNTPAGAGSVALQDVTLRAGKVNVPLRSSQVRGVAAPMQYNVLPGSGKVEVTLFVATDVEFPESQ